MYPANKSNSYNNLINFLDKYLLLILYFSLIIGFFLNENTLGGSLSDYQNQKIIAKKFSQNFINTFLNYDKEPHRHSPLLIIILSIFEKFNISDIIIRLINLHFLLLIILFFKKCLDLKFDKINKKIINIISLLILLSPTFRSLAIWPDSRLYGMLFFIISILFFLKFLKSTIRKTKFKYAILNSIFLAIASYFSPNFCVFIIFFLFYFIKYFYNSKFIYILIFFNIIIAFPAIYYVFFLKIYFFLTPATNEINKFIIFNPANKILLISSIFLFHYLPVIFFIKKKFKYLKRIFFITFPIFLCSVYYFNYSNNFTGGGVIFKGSNIILGNNYSFYVFSFIGMLLICHLSYKNLNNFLLIFLIFLNNPQLEVYHKYYDPMLFILFFTLFNLNIKKFLLEKKVLILYFFNSLFLILNFLR
jgi:hypothetical protein